MNDCILCPNDQGSPFIWHLFGLLINLNFQEPLSIWILSVLAESDRKNVDKNEI